MKFLIYCATPSRLLDKTEEIMDFVTKEGNAPFHPFVAFPFERYENGPIGREKTMEFCQRAVGICDKVYMFGISEGVLDDAKEGMLLGKPVESYVKIFDADWEKYYDSLVSKEAYTDILLKTVGKK